MQDGAPSHTTRLISTKYPENLNIRTEWPPFSPDLTPLELVRVDRMAVRNCVSCINTLQPWHKPTVGSYVLNSINEATKTKTRKQSACKL